MRFALIGHPISHSLSPALFLAAYPFSNHTYELLETHSLEEALMIIRIEGFEGFNVTTPYKEEILKYAHYRNPLVDLIGASNLILNSDKRMSAFNTDFFGVQECIKDYARKGNKAVVLGCGGAGKAAALAARSVGFNVTIVNRSSARAINFSKHSGIIFKEIDLLEEEVRSCNLLINTISVHLNILNGLDYKGKIILEANYRSPQLSFTENLSDTKYISGKTWLLNQAVQSFQLMTASSPNLESMQYMINNI
jgi:shikimate dehydrogenase